MFTNTYIHSTLTHYTQNRFHVVLREKSTRKSTSRRDLFFFQSITHIHTHTDEIKIFENRKKKKMQLKPGEKQNLKMQRKSVEEMKDVTRGKLLRVNV